MVELSVSAEDAALLASLPLALTNLAAGQMAVREDSQGRYVDVDVPYLRLNPGEAADVTLWATKFGQPWSGAVLPVALQPIVPAANGGPWNNNDPQKADFALDDCGHHRYKRHGRASVDRERPGHAAKYADGQLGPDGQIYGVICPPGGPADIPSWPSLGQIFLFAGAPISVLVFSRYPIPPRPTWDEHVGPIFGLYVRLYPFMKGIVDLADYDTVNANASDIQAVLNLPQTSPHYMPIVRDLSGTSWR